MDEKPSKVMNTSGAFFYILQTDSKKNLHFIYLSYLCTELLI